VGLILTSSGFLSLSDSSRTSESKQNWQEKVTLLFHAPSTLLEQALSPLEARIKVALLLTRE